MDRGYMILRMDEVFRTFVLITLGCLVFAGGCRLSRKRKEKDKPVPPGENPAYYESVRRMSAEMERQQELRRDMEYSPMASERRRLAREARDFEFRERAFHQAQQYAEDARFLEAAASEAAGR